jgi:hypothetical protein
MGDYLRGVAESVLQLLMETGAEGVIDAGRHERRAERTPIAIGAASATTLGKSVAAARRSRTSSNSPASTHYHRQVE